MKDRKRFYVVTGSEGARRIVSRDTRPLLGGAITRVIGPFHTKRGAQYMVAHGDRCRTVYQAEKLAAGGIGQEQERRGRMIVDVLGLKPIRGMSGRYNTAWGDKTPLGLFLTMKRIVEEGA